MTPFSSRIFRATDVVTGTLDVALLDGNERVGAIGKASYPQDGLIGFGLLRNYRATTGWCLTSRRASCACIHQQQAA